MTLPGRNCNYDVGVWYTLQTQLGHYLCSPEHIIQGDLIHGLTIYQDSIWVCASIEDLRTLFTALMPRNKAVRKSLKCNIPTLVRISREPYQMGLLKTGEQPMTALKIVECRALTDEERTAMKAEKPQEEKEPENQTETSQPDVRNLCDAETSPVPTQPHDTEETTSACQLTAPPLCPVDRVVELFPRPLYCA